MGQKVQPKCMQCEKTESVMWRNIEIGQICNECFELNRENVKRELENESENDKNKKIRKSTRCTRNRKVSPTNPKQQIPKGKSRRCIFKGNKPMRTPTTTASTQSVNSLFYNVGFTQIRIS